MELAGILIVVIATFAIGTYGVRVARTTSDFFVASRQVGATMNASAICGEYISAASFLGAAGLIMRYGSGMLWLPLAYAAGYLFLLLFVAAPLRRFGAYTVPDFAEGRLDSLFNRRIAMIFVLAIGWFYLLPQMKGAGLTLTVITGSPYWVGVVVVGTVITVNVAIGGMRGITFVQAFQYWVKVVAIGVPALIFITFIHHPNQASLTQPVPPRFANETSVKFARSVSVEVSERVRLTGTGVVDGSPLSGPVELLPGIHNISKGARLTLPGGAAVPLVKGTSVNNNERWALPYSLSGNDRPHPLYANGSLLVAQLLGVMGLPHILVRFYTNSDGHTARRTTLFVLCLLGLFYIFPAVHGALGRLYAPRLLMTGSADAVVLVLPRLIVGGVAGGILAGLVAAGAMAAFLSTASGLLIAVSGALSQDLLSGSVRDFRRMAVMAGSIAILFGLQVRDIDLNVLVGWAFGVAASSLCPLLVLGIWWRGLSRRGAAAGMLTGGSLATISVLLTMIGVRPGGWLGAILSQPAAITAPLGFLVMVLVSRATTSSVPGAVSAKMVHLHLPEAIGLGRNWRD
jgi:Na+(H+)/acetate symporter ActP